MLRNIIQLNLKSHKNLTTCLETSLSFYAGQKNNEKKNSKRIIIHGLSKFSYISALRGAIIATRKYLKQKNIDKILHSSFSLMNKSNIKFHIYLLLLYLSWIACCARLGALRNNDVKCPVQSFSSRRLYPEDNSISWAQTCSMNVCCAMAIADAAKILEVYCKNGSASSNDNSHKYCKCQMTSISQIWLNLYYRVLQLFVYLFTINFAGSTPYIKSITFVLT